MKAKLRHAVASLVGRNLRRKGDSGRRHYTLEAEVAGAVTMDGYCVSITDPVTGKLIGKVHPLSFIEMVLEEWNKQ